MQLGFVEAVGTLGVRHTCAGLGGREARRLRQHRQGVGLSAGRVHLVLCHHAQRDDDILRGRKSVARQG